MYTIDEIMTTDLVTLYENDSLLDAREIMQKERIRHLPIVSHTGTFIGLITNRDILANAVSVLADITDREKTELESSIKVGDIMNRNVFVAGEGVELMEAAQHLIEHKHGCLPVVDGRKNWLVSLPKRTLSGWLPTCWSKWQCKSRWSWRSNKGVCFSR